MNLSEILYSTQFNLGPSMSLCERCGKSFDCGMQDAASNAPCWCAHLPALPASLLASESLTCYCPDCLTALIAKSNQESA